MSLFQHIKIYHPRLKHHSPPLKSIRDQSDTPSLYQGTVMNMRDHGIDYQEDRTKAWLLKQSVCRSSQDNIKYSDSICRAAKNTNRQSVSRSSGDDYKYSDSFPTSASNTNKHRVCRSCQDNSQYSDSYCSGTSNSNTMPCNIAKNTNKPTVD